MKFKAKYFSLLLIGLTSCQLTNETGSFKAGASLSSATSTSSKAWRSPYALDFNEYDLTYFNNNNNSSTVGNSPMSPMSVVCDGKKSFHAIFNHATCDIIPACTLYYYMWATQTQSFASDTWGTSGASFSRLDGTDSQIESAKPVSAVDSAGNIMTVYTSTNAAGVYRPVGVRHNKTSNSWGASRDISSAAMTTTLGFDSQFHSAALAFDSSDNAVVVWCQGDPAGNPVPFWNEYRALTGWRFSTSASILDMSIDGATTYCSEDDTGMDIDFDGSGAGLVAFVSKASDTMVVKEWENDAWSGAVETVLGATTQDMLPRIFIDSTGLANLFFHRNASLITGSGELHLSIGTEAADFSATASTLVTTGVFAFYAGDTFNAGASKAFLKPVLASNGDTAIMLFIKSDGASRRLYYMTYQGSGSWTSPVALNTGGAGLDVVWADAAVSANGSIAVVFAQVAADGMEHVYGNVYNGSWQGETQLDTSTYTAAVAPDGTRPSVAIDSDGNAVATFTMRVGAVKRAVGVSFR